MSVLEGHARGAFSVCAFTLDGRPLLAATDDLGEWIWDPATGAQLSALEGHTRGVWSVCALTLDGRPLLASSSSDQTVRIWDPATETQWQVLQGHTNWVRSMCAFTVNQRTLLATGSGDRTVRIWDPLAATTVLSIPVHSPVLTVGYASELLWWVRMRGCWQSD